MAKGKAKKYRALKPLASQSLGTILPGQVFEVDFSSLITHDGAPPGEKAKVVTETVEEWLLRESFVEIVTQEVEHGGN